MFFTSNKLPYYFPVTVFLGNRVLRGFQGGCQSHHIDVDDNLLNF